MINPRLRIGLTSAAFFASMAIAGVPAKAQPALMVETVTVSDVKAAQNAWCDALVAISKAHNEGGLAKSKPLAGDVIDAAYGYQFGAVAFKPTWAKVTPRFDQLAMAPYRISLVMTQPSAILALRLELLGPIGVPG